MSRSDRGGRDAPGEAGWGRIQVTAPYSDHRNPVGPDDPAGRFACGPAQRPAPTESPRPFGGTPFQKGALGVRLPT